MKRLWLVWVGLLWWQPALAEEPVVHWFHPDFPPYFIQYGPLKDKGSADQIEAFLRQELGGYRHLQVKANAARRQEEFKSRTLACTSAVLRSPEREAYMVFSEAFTEILPNGLVSLRRRQAELEPFLNAAGELDLAALLAARSFHLSVAAGRSFGPAIDQVLASAQARGQLSVSNASDMFASGMLQLQHDQKVGGVLGYALELSWAVRRFDLPYEDFRFTPIAGAGGLSPAYLGCSRSAEGERLVARVNALIRSGRLREVATRAYMEWLPPDARHYYERLLKAGARSGS